MIPSILFIIGLLFGYTFFLFMSDPGKRKNVLPKIAFGNIEILPNLRIRVGNTYFWIHHWIYLSVIILISFIIIQSITQLVFMRGIAVGGILQGLRYKDRFRVRS